MSEVNPRRHYIILRHYHTDFLKLYLAHLAILSSLGRVYDRVYRYTVVYGPCIGLRRRVAVYTIRTLSQSVVITSVNKSTILLFTGS